MIPRVATIFTFITSAKVSNICVYLRVNALLSFIRMIKTDNLKAEKSWQSYFFIRHLFIHSTLCRLLLSRSSQHHRLLILLFVLLITINGPYLITIGYSLKAVLPEICGTTTTAEDRQSDCLLTTNTPRASYGCSLWGFGWQLTVW